MHRHKSIEWDDVLEKLDANYDKLCHFIRWKKTDGEPDVISYDKQTNEYVFLIVQLVGVQTLDNIRELGGALFCDRQ